MIIKKKLPSYKNVAGGSRNAKKNVTFYSNTVHTFCASLNYKSFQHLGTQQGKENSRMYNEMVVLKLVQSMTKMISSPPEVFQDHIYEHFRKNGNKFYLRIKSWMELSDAERNQNEAILAGKTLQYFSKMMVITLT